MEETDILREITNLPIDDRLEFSKEREPSISSESSDEVSRPPLDELISISHGEIDFGYCLPGHIYERSLTVTLKEEMEEPCSLEFLINCEDEGLYDSSSLVFGIKRLGQSEYYDEYKMKVKNKKSYEFKVGVQTPMFYEYNVESILYVQFLDYAPMAVVLKQKAQVPELLSIKELYLEESRMLKLSYSHGKGKKECRIPFKLNHPMTISVIAEVLGLEPELNPLVDVKPKSMTLTGKGQFSLSISMNLNEQIMENLRKGVTFVIRRILTLTIKDTKFIYHFPIEATYLPESSKEYVN